MRNILVTGGTGFLGGALVRRLLAEGHRVRTLVRREVPALRALGAELHLGDIRDREALHAACADIELVFHTAALAGGWGPPRDFEAVNVHGTQNVLDACAARGVRALVYTSSPSVVFDCEDIEGGDESLPYAGRYLAHYPRTKALAERRVLDASTETLPTLSLRPHLIWGPGDRHLLPRLVARAGKLKRVGRGDPLTDTIYIDNCVQAHVLAGERLLAEPTLGGRAFFISDDQPVGIWSMANHMLEAAGAPPIRGRVPASLAYGAGALLELAHFLLRRSEEPMVTRFAAAQLARAQWFDISAAKEALGYRPLVTIEEGLERLRASFQDQTLEPAAERSTG